jgi:hypothetical protein
MALGEDQPILFGILPHSIEMRSPLASIYKTGIKQKGKKDTIIFSKGKQKGNEAPLS